jgi:hypothetical protein
MKKKLSQLTKEEFSTLQSLGILDNIFAIRDNAKVDHEFLDERNAEAKKIIKKIVACCDEYDIIKLKTLAQKWLSKYG